jgi:hypothetical protein
MYPRSKIANPNAQAKPLSPPISNPILFMESWWPNDAYRSPADLNDGEPKIKAFLTHLVVQVQS